MVVKNERNQIIKRPPYIGEDGLCHMPLQDGTEAICDADNFDLVAGGSWSIKNNCSIYRNIKSIFVVLTTLLFPEIRDVIFINASNRDYRRENIKEGFRQCWVEGDICYIPIPNGKIAICDADRFEEVRKYSWSMNTHQHVRGYINGDSILLHRFLFPGFTKTLDHISRDTLDNRKSNLRQATNSENGINASPGKANTTGYKGVVFEKRYNNWNARITKDGKRTNLGNYKTAERVAVAYDQEATKLFGEFAWLNFSTEEAEKILKENPDSIPVTPPVEFRGVSISYGRFRARITVKRKQTEIGRFDTAEEAAKAYDRVASQVWGNMAALNFPEELVEVEDIGF